jgi:progressive ankylosis protein
LDRSAGRSAAAILHERSRQQRVSTATRDASHLARSHRTIFLFWVPLAAQWFMMAAEGPFLAAIIARMGDPAHNLAAYGVAFAFAILIESPVIMLMSAATALVDDAASYRRLRNFANALNTGATLLLLVVLVPAVYDGLMLRVLGLPAEVARLVYGALWLLLPWPAAIGYRRFLHGVLIRSGRTRLIAYGTLLRLTGMSSTAILLYGAGAWPGAWVGAAALSMGVCVEAAATRIMARRALHELLSAAPAPAGTVPHALGYRDISRFYYPLALTSFIALTVHPMLTFFMGRSPFPVESLAVFPVVHALSFLFRSPGFSYQEAAIALLGRRCENLPMLARFGTVLGLATSALMALVVFTPLAELWFGTLSGLPPALMSFALTPARILVPLPALAVLLALQQAVLVQRRSTRAISASSALEVGTIAVLFAAIGRGTQLTGVTVAVIALLGGRLAGNLFLAFQMRRPSRDLHERARAVV